MVRNLSLIFHLILFHCTLNQFFLTLSHSGHGKQVTIAFLITNLIACHCHVLSFLESAGQTAQPSLLLSTLVIIVITFLLTFGYDYVSFYAHQYIKNMMSDETTMPEARPAWVKIRKRKD